MPFLVAALVIVGIPGILVAAGLVYQRTGYHDVAVKPVAVRPGADRALSVGVQWLTGGMCLGELTARATETPSVVKVSVTDRVYTRGGACAGVGTTYNMAWADVTLAQPLGSRSAVRSSDGAVLPVYGPKDTFLPDGATSATVERFGGLNDQPPLGLQKSASLTDPAAVAGLLEALNALAPYPQGPGIYCPFDDGSHYSIDLVYPDGALQAVRVAAKGCQGVFLNGSAKPVAWGLSSNGAGAALFSLLGSLVGQ